MSDVTRILDRVQHGHAQVVEELLPLVYDELRKLAAHKMADEAPPDPSAHRAGPRNLATAGR